MEKISQFFSYKHLSEMLQNTSRPFCELHDVIISTIPASDERTVALRKLLESKDAAVRAMLIKDKEND